jgi:hypothetical protein
VRTGSPCSSIGETSRYSIVSIVSTKGCYVVSDGGAIKDCLFLLGIIGSDYEVLWECKGIARGYPMHSYRAKGYCRISLLLLLTYYLRYLGIHPLDDMCITSYCDNSIILNREEELYTRDIDS